MITVENKETLRFQVPEPLCSTAARWRRRYGSPEIGTAAGFEQMTGIGQLVGFRTGLQQQVAASCACGMAAEACMEASLLVLKISWMRSWWIISVILRSSRSIVAVDRNVLLFRSAEMRTLSSSDQ
jgi:hypothetical protein